MTSLYKGFAEELCKRQKEKNKPKVYDVYGTNNRSVVSPEGQPIVSKSDLVKALMDSGHVQSARDLHIWDKKDDMAHKFEKCMARKFEEQTADD